MKHFAAFLPAIAWAALIFFLSSLPELPPAPLVFPGVDKVAHGGVYAVLTILLLLGHHRAAGSVRQAPLGLGPANRPVRTPTATLWVAVAATYGLLDELHQALVPGRSPDFWDWLADAVGALLGLLLWTWLLRVSNASRSTPTAR